MSQEQTAQVTIEVAVSFANSNGEVWAAVHNLEIHAVDLEQTIGEIRDQLETGLMYRTLKEMVNP